MISGGQANRLPVVRIVAAALVLAWERRQLLVRAAWLPLLLGAAITVAETQWGPSSWMDGSPAEDGGPRGSALPWIISVLLITVMVSVRSYRVFLMDQEQGRFAAPLSWGLRETRFVIATMAVAFAFVAASLAFGGVITAVWPGAGDVVPAWLYILLVVAGPAWLVARLWMAFPALATGQFEEIFLALSQSWNLTRNNGLNVLLLCVLTPSAIAWGLDQVSQLPLPGLALVCAVAVWLLMPFELAIVALCYATLNRRALADDSGPDA